MMIKLGSVGSKPIKVHVLMSHIADPLPGGAKIPDRTRLAEARSIMDKGVILC